MTTMDAMTFAQQISAGQHKIGADHAKSLGIPPPHTPIRLLLEWLRIIEMQGSMPFGPVSRMQRIVQAHLQIR